MSADSNIAQDFSGFRIARQAIRSEKRAIGAETLRKAGIAFDAKNGGAHLVVTCCPGRIVDFWPGTGLWIPRGTAVHRQYGLKQLLKWIEINRKENE